MPGTTKNNPNRTLEGPFQVVPPAILRAAAAAPAAPCNQFLWRPVGLNRSPDGVARALFTFRPRRIAWSAILGSIRAWFTVGGLSGVRIPIQAARVGARFVTA